MLWRGKSRSPMMTHQFALPRRSWRPTSPNSARGSRRRRGRRRLDPSRCHGWTFRAELNFGPTSSSRCAATPGNLRLPPDDRAGRSLPRSLREGGCDIITVMPKQAPHLHRSLQTVSRSERKRVLHQSGDAGKRHRICPRHRRSRSCDDGQSWLRRPEVHRRDGGEDPRISQ